MSGSSLRKIIRGGLESITIDDLRKQAALGMGREIRRLVIRKAPDRETGS